MKSPILHPPRIASDLIATLSRWQRTGRRGALATVTNVEGPAPVAVGPAFAVNDVGEVVGSIGGGCFEAAVIAEAHDVLTTGESIRRTYESGDGIVTVASPCGGSLTLTIDVVTKSTLTMLATNRDASASLYLVGANAYAAALVAIARQIDYKISIVDPRPAFLTSRRFTGATMLLGWPEEIVPTDALAPRDAVVILAHDERFEDRFLPSVLASDVGYVGALGSRNANGKRFARLRAAGVGEAQISRLAAPAGLDVGAYDVAEVAISIIAEIIAVRHGRPGGRLRDGSGPIHSKIA